MYIIVSVSFIVISTVHKDTKGKETIRQQQLKSAYILCISRCFATQTFQCEHQQAQLLLKTNNDRPYFYPDESAYTCDIASKRHLQYKAKPRRYQQKRPAKA